MFWDHRTLGSQLFSYQIGSYNYLDLNQELDSEIQKLCNSHFIMSNIGILSSNMFRSLMRTSTDSSLLTWDHGFLGEISYKITLVGGIRAFIFLDP